jgi:hypothetical protein
MSVSGAAMCYPLRSEAPERLAAAASNCHLPEQLMQGHRVMADPMGDQRHVELLRELREIKREINSVPKKRDLSLVACVILGTIALLFLFRDILGWVFSH